MKAILSAYRRDEDRIQGMSLEDFALLLLEATDERGILYVPDSSWLTREKEIGSRYLRCLMDWDREAALALAREMEDLLQLLKETAEGKSSSVRNTGKAFDEEWYRVWKTYLKAMPDLTFEKDLDRMVSTIVYVECNPRAKQLQKQMQEVLRQQPRQLRGGWDLGPLPPEQEVLSYWDGVGRLQKEAVRRMKTPLMAYEQVLLGKWIYLLYGYGAPEEMIRDKAQELLQFTAIGRFGRETTLCEIERGLGIPLWEISNKDLVMDWFEGKIQAYQEDYPWEELPSLTNSMRENMSLREILDLGLWTPMVALDRNITVGKYRADIYSDEFDPERLVLMIGLEYMASQDPPVKAEEFLAALREKALTLGVDESKVGLYELSWRR